MGRRTWALVLAAVAAAVIAVVVAREAADAGLSAAAERGAFDPETEVDAAMWWPEYVPYVRNRVEERRRVVEA